jgi:glycosyltransferase involved in cell wall biosynthesis
MNICLNHYAFFPMTGGVESHLLDLGSELIRQGHTVHALIGSMAGQSEYSEIQGIQVYRRDLMNPEWIRDWKAQRGLKADEVTPEIMTALKQMYVEFIEKHNIDVMHGHNFHHFVPGHALILTELWADGLPNVLTVHEVWSEFICEDLLQRAKWDYIITFCKHVTDGIRQQAPHLDNLRMIHPGIDVDLFSPNNQNDKWANQLKLRGRPVIIHPARMLPWKGVIYSVRAMEIVRKEYPDALLIITDTEDIVDWIGELKDYKKEIHRTIQEKKLSHNIISQSFPYSELPWVYNCCDIIIYPTIGEEPFGLVPVEGMACAKPVIVTRSGGMVESVLDGQTGFVIEKENPELLADKILLLLRDKELASRMGQNGRRWVTTEFSRERMARETVVLYEDARRLAEERRRRGKATNA